VNWGKLGQGTALGMDVPVGIGMCQKRSHIEEVAEVAPGQHDKRSPMSISRYWTVSDDRR
jgi:hypothetical protein